jgi:hypothetical protein
MTNRWRTPRRTHACILALLDWIQQDSTQRHPPRRTPAPAPYAGVPITLGSSLNTSITWLFYTLRRRSAHAPTSANFTRSTHGNPEDSAFTSFMSLWLFRVNRSSLLICEPCSHCNLSMPPTANELARLNHRAAHLHSAWTWRTHTQTRTHAHTHTHTHTHIRSMCPLHLCIPGSLIVASRGLGT